MATAFAYTEQTTLPHLVEVFASVGAHLAAKLEAFGSDERTLTDELCDMSCIWTVHSSRRRRKNTHSRLPNTPLNISFGKTTVPEESVNGADLKLLLNTPSGSKTALFQAKVVEPAGLYLRRNMPNDWKKLRRQLLSMRSRVGATAFLLLYVPANQLNGRRQSYGTWEQGFVQKGAGTLSSRNGATVIPADDLIGFAGRWKTRKKLQNVSTGRFSPPGISFARLMLELVSCARGQYSRSFKQSDDFRDFRQLSVSIEANEREWDNAIETTRTWLRDHPERLNDDEQPEEGPS